MRLKYKNEIFKVLHQSSVADFEAGAITEEQMREYDRACLEPEAQSAPKAARTTKRALASASV
jgi:DNA-binding transcriptional regulator YiaG